MMIEPLDRSLFITELTKEGLLLWKRNNRTFKSLKKIEHLLKHKDRSRIIKTYKKLS